MLITIITQFFTIFEPQDNVSIMSRVCYGIFCAINIGIEIPCVLLTIKNFRDMRIRSEISLAFLHIAMHLMLLTRFLYFLFYGVLVNRSNLVWSSISLRVTAKDVFLLALSCRILESIYVFNVTQSIYMQASKALYIGTVIYAAGSIMVCAIVLGLSLDNDYINLYGFIMEFIIIVIYILSFAMFFSYVRKNKEEVETLGDNYLKWLMIIMIYMIISLSLIVTMNALESFGVLDTLRNNKFDAFVFLDFGYTVATEYVPAIGMIICLHNMTKKSPTMSFLIQND